MVLIDILEEHIEEADFLWQQRENALADRAYNLEDLAELEERLLAHIDGLVLADEAGWRLLLPKLSSDAVGEVFAAAFVAFESGNQERIDQVLKVFPTAENEVLDGIRHALRHTTYPEIETITRSYLDAEQGAIQTAAVDILSFRRAPIEESRLMNLLLHPDPNVVTSACNAVGRLRRMSMTKCVDPLLEHPIPRIRQEAMKAGLLLQSEKARRACLQAIQKNGEEAGPAIVFIGQAGEAQALPLLVDKLADPTLARDAVTAIGLLGSVIAMEPLLRCCSDPTLARRSGEAIQTLTGVDLEKEKLIVPPPSPTETPEQDEEAFDTDLDEALPYPDPEKVVSWWKANTSRFDKRLRHRKGLPYGPLVLIDLLKTGNLLERHDVAFELALLHPRLPYLETDTFVVYQRKEMARIDLGDVPTS